MNNVQATPGFKREFKPLYKKYPTLKDSLNKLIEDLIKDLFWENRTARKFIKSD